MLFIFAAENLRFLYLYYYLIIFINIISHLITYYLQI